MLQTQLFSKITKEAPKEEQSLNARLLEQAGFVAKTLAGVYNFLPLGNRVLKNIENIVREEMDKIGVEILMSSLQSKENWQQTGRWQDLDVLFKLKSQQGFEYALGATHEELVTPLAKRAIFSYRDLPLAVYQIQTKFRDELRAKSGLMRGREFRMKDLYSFHANQEDLEKYYLTVQKAYFRIFKRLGLKALLTEASGGTFSKFSHEFQVAVPAGEDQIFICEKCGLAKNREVYSGPKEECTNCGKTTWREENASEVGNIFKLQTKYSAPFDLKFIDAEGKQQLVIMGCYGIGTTRLMGVIAELYNDQNGLVWPENVAPFKYHILPLYSKNLKIQKQIKAAAASIGAAFQKAGVEVLLDDREENPGVKFKDADLIGIPNRVVVSEKTLAKKSIEIKKRKENKAKNIGLGQFLKSVAKQA